MEAARYRTPFVVVLVVTAIVCLAVLRLPSGLLARLQTDGFLTPAQSDWAYRLLALAALAQAVYGAFFVLQSERIAGARKRDPKLAAMSNEALLASVARNAAGMTVPTIVYGIAALSLSGQRGGFWLFPLIFLAQIAWYYRQVGEIARWLNFQPEPHDDASSRYRWKREPPDYCPPIARGLTATND